MPPAALAALRPPAAPPGGRARALCGAQCAFRRIEGGRVRARCGARRSFGRIGWCYFVNRWTARGGPCQSSGVGNQAQQGLRSAVSSERPEGRMPEGSVRRDGMGHPEPRHPGCRSVGIDLSKCLREIGDSSAVDARRRVCEPFGEEICHARPPTSCHLGDRLGDHRRWLGAGRRRVHAPRSAARDHS